MAKVPKQRMLHSWLKVPAESSSPPQPSTWTNLSSLWECHVFQLSPCSVLSPEQNDSVAIKGQSHKIIASRVMPFHLIECFIMGDKIWKYWPFSFQVGCSKYEEKWTSPDLHSGRLLIWIWSPEAHPETGIMSKRFVQDLLRGDPTRE